MESPLRRHPANPVLEVSELPGDDHVLVFNAGVVVFGGRYLMAYRVDRGVHGDPLLHATDVGFAWSDDGLAWKPEPETRFPREGAIELLQQMEPHRSLEPELWRMYDPRLTVVDDDGRERLLMSFAVDTTHGLRAGLATSVDAVSWTPLFLGVPDNRNHVVFPERIGDRWVRLERPMNEYGAEALGAGAYGVWLSRSPDLVHWGDHRFLVDRSAFPFADDKVGPGAPPIRTDEGWLCLLHTVTLLSESAKRGWEDEWNKVYRAAAVLLDLEDPSRVRAVGRLPVLSPSEDVAYETSGYRGGVVFPTGAVVRPGPQGDELWMYYGSADTSVALATGLVDDVVAFVLASGA